MIKFRQDLSSSCITHVFQRNWRMDTKYDVEAYGYIFLFHARPLPSRPEDAG